MFTYFGSQPLRLLGVIAESGRDVKVSGCGFDVWRMGVSVLGAEEYGTSPVIEK